MQEKSQQEILEILKKVKKLASSGFQGESEAAKKILHKVASKYKIDLDQLDDEARRFIARASGWRLSLLIQLCAVVCGVDNFKVLKTASSGSYEFECRESEWLEIMSRFKILEKDYKQQLSMFYEAFLICNNLTIKQPQSQNDQASQSKDIKKLQKLANGLTKSAIAAKSQHPNIQKMLECQTSENQ